MTPHEHDGFAKFGNVPTDGAHQPNLVKIKLIKVADKVFGPDVAPLQGKMVSCTPQYIDPAYVQILPEIISSYLNVIVVADLMFVNGLPFLVSISWNITLIMVSYMPSCTTADLCKGMMQIVLVYQRQGTTVTTVMVDNQFYPLGV